MQPTGRISLASEPRAGCGKDRKRSRLRKTVELEHSQGQTMGNELAHAGAERASVATEEARGGGPGDVYGPSAIAYSRVGTMPSPSR